MKDLLFTLLTCFTITAYAQTDTIINRGVLLTENKFYEIDYTNTENPIFIKGNIKNESCKLLMDSGAPAFISSTIQEKYHFRSLANCKTVDATGKENNIEIVLVDSLSFGPFLFQNIPALVFDMKGSPIECDGLAGNIGSNVLRHLNIKFDIANGKIFFADNKSLLTDREATYSPVRIDQQSDVYFPVKVNNDLVDTVHFDTGDGYLFHISKDAAIRLRTACNKCVLREGTGAIAMGQFGLGESFFQEVFKVKSLEIGHGLTSGGLLYIANNNRSRIGRGILNYGVLELDYTRSQLAFIPYKEPVSQLKYDYGVVPVVNGNKVIVGMVWNGSEAVQQGVKVNDEIIAIGGIYLSSVSTCEIEVTIKQLLSQESVVFLIKHNGSLHSHLLHRTRL